MSASSLPLSVKQIGRTLGVCRGNATRKVVAAERFIGRISGQVAGAKASPYRKRVAIVAAVSTLARLMAARPAECNTWIESLIQEVQS